MSFEVLLVYFLLLLLVAFGGKRLASPLQFGLELLFKGGSGFLLLLALTFDPIYRVLFTFEPLYHIILRFLGPSWLNLLMLFEDLVIAVKAHIKDPEYYNPGEVLSIWTIRFPLFVVN